ncbi:ABC transporter permease [Leucobacter tardus]|uniref:ABC transporter permease subunit n=1 Tax=Leucobacter tardus TaxID=501483 RepID=A0A939QCA3_9MICO|nr:ABC transporter permease subunit [Leucobacter tardus]MBO2989152.1 ABC transporter permease subunit [Leucobacter tardus]
MTISSLDRAPGGQHPSTGAAPRGRSPRRDTGEPRRGRLIAALGTLPFFAFIGLFLVAPVAITVAGAFTNADGAFTLENFAALGQEQYVNAFMNSLTLSAVTAIIGGVLGLVLGWALMTATRPAALHRLVTSLAAVASQMGGPPLAFAFIAFMGTQGLLTVWLQGAFGFELNQVLPISSFWAIVLAYLYFQVPLMALLSLSALHGVRREWQDGGMSLGAGRVRILATITLPILAPSLVGGVLLLFANAFSGYAAAYAMAGSGANLVPILIGFFLSGNVLVNQGLASALITGMIVVMVVAMGARALLLRRSARWQQ